MTSRGCEEMFSPWEQPLMDKRHSLKTYFLFTCTSLTDFYKSHTKPKIFFMIRHDTEVLLAFLMKLFHNSYDTQMCLYLFVLIFFFFFFNLSLFLK